MALAGFFNALFTVFVEDSHTLELWLYLLVSLGAVVLVALELVEISGLLFLVGLILLIPALRAAIWVLGVHNEDSLMR